MTHRIAFYVVLLIGLLGLAPNEAFAQETEMVGWGTGTVTFDGESRDARLVAWEKSEEHFLEMQAEGRTFRIDLDEDNGQEAHGYLRPIKPFAGEAYEDDVLCSGEKECPCKLQADEDDTEMTGSCDVPTEEGKKEFSFQFSVE